jgi:5,10-methenyltetrahydrofolate synthetase
MPGMHGNSLKTLRQELLTQRTHFAASTSYLESLSKLTAGLIQFLGQQNPTSVALYVPIKNEPDLRPTLLSWSSGNNDRQLALPFARPDKYLEFYTWEDGDVLILSKHHVFEPDPKNAQRSLTIPDCILIPCVGWSQSKVGGKSYYWRLGYGGGYFDRTLAHLRKAKPGLLCIGVGFDWQQLDDNQWQAQTHDEPLDFMLTESALKG